MLSVSSWMWIHSSKNDKLDTLREAVNQLIAELKEERAARLRLLKYLALKEVDGPRIEPMVTE